MNIIQTLEAERMTRKVPEFKPGDTVVVQIKVVEGDRERVQAYEGVVIARSNRGFNSSFTVRKISHGEGVERTFQISQPEHQRDRGQAPRQRAPRQAVLPARSGRQGRAHRGEGLKTRPHGRPMSRRLRARVRCHVVFRGLWHSLDVLRRFLHLLLLLALFGSCSARCVGPPRACRRKRALVVRPSGDIVEQLSGEPLERAMNEAQGDGHAADAAVGSDRPRFVPRPATRASGAC